MEKITEEFTLSSRCCLVEITEVCVYIYKNIKISIKVNFALLLLFKTIGGVFLLCVYPSSHKATSEVYQENQQTISFDP